MKFKLQEMPYISLPDSQEQDVFDLQLEELSSIEELLELIDSIFKGKKYKDKYGNIIELKNRNDKKTFLDNLIHNKIFVNIIENKFKLNLQKFINHYKNYI